MNLRNAVAKLSKDTKHSIVFFFFAMVSCLWFCVFQFTHIYAIFAKIMH